MREGTSHRARTGAHLPSPTTRLGPCLGDADRGAAWRQPDVAHAHMYIEHVRRERVGLAGLLCVCLPAVPQPAAAASVPCLASGHGIAAKAKKIRGGLPRVQGRQDEANGGPPLRTRGGSGSCVHKQQLVGAAVRDRADGARAHGSKRLHILYRYTSRAHKYERACA
eukprot:scaffold897_cov402-Prasinococcus_capsulatus_cf.AAC.39